MIDVPSRMATLPIDPKRGHPVPFFVAWFDAAGKEVAAGEGVPDYKVINSKAMRTCFNNNRCWLCGQNLYRLRAHVIGPMCAINRTTSEPGSHIECASYAVRVCPFLSNPVARMAATEVKLKTHPGLMPPAGFFLERNPGVACIWLSPRAKPMTVPGGNGVLFQLPSPVSVSWWCKGREATRAEIVSSINGGLPTLIKLAGDEGALPELARFISRMKPLLPEGTEQIMAAEYA